MIRQYSYECKHHPSSHINGVLRFGEFVIQREKALNGFQCYFCGSHLQIPNLYNNPFLKIGYMCFSILMTLALFQLKNIEGFFSEISNMLLMCLVYLIMFLLQMFVSAAILAFSNWEQATGENNAQKQRKILECQDRNNSFGWLIGISLSAGYVVGITPWILVAVVLIIVAVTIFQNQ